MKLHRPLVSAVIQLLQQIFEYNHYADKIIEQTLKQHPKWGARDRRFVAETVYEVVRWWRFYKTILELNELPSVAGYYKILGIHLLLKNEQLPEWEEWKDLDKEHIYKQAARISEIRKLRESIPDWLDDTGCKALGEEIWTKELHALNQEAKVVLRVNTLKATRSKLQQLLMEQQIETILPPHYPSALILHKRKQLHSLQAYQQGLFEVQDASSQLVVPFAEVQPGMFVIDACAGAGGKSLHLAACMQNKGIIISTDIEERKLNILQQRSMRAGVSIIHTHVMSAALLKKYAQTADRLLLDVPCSGLGVLKRNPDTKWKLTPSFLQELIKTQQTILQHYSVLVKPSGNLVYATCSILPQENQQQIAFFLERNKDQFQLIEEHKIMPSNGFDGFYMAKLKRVN